MIRIQKGLKDVLPQESYKWQYIENKAREITALYGFKEIRTPTFEATELFLRGVGETTDIVNKEMYTFFDKGNRSITLKPEGTAAVARSYIENNISQNTNPAKMYYITPLFRYERPQSGRLREHHQFGIEIFGSDNYIADLEVMTIGYNFFKSLGIEDISLEVNNIGCRDCRPSYNAALKSFYRENINSLCPLCRERLETNPLRILDCKADSCRELNEKAPIISDFLCDSCNNHKYNLYKSLDNIGIKYNENGRIVRGLDYYTGTVFEFISSSLGAKSTVCGGGRYNHLVEEIGGKYTPAVGFGLGLERLLIIMEKLGLYIGEDCIPSVYIANISPNELSHAGVIASKFRGFRISTDLNLLDKSFNAQMKSANKVGYKYVLVVGEAETNSGVYSLRNMKDGNVYTGTIDDVINYIINNQ